jgi:hypothetical protein
MSSEDLSRITLWRINNGYEENQATKLQQYLTNCLQRRELPSIRKKGKNKTSYS